jgi:hypothetical protein
MDRLLGEQKENAERSTPNAEFLRRSRFGVRRLDAALTVKPINHVDSFL